MAHREPLTALQLFRNGHDTHAIANMLNIPESQALKSLTIQRSRELGLSNPYQQPEARPASRIPYAGHSRLSSSGGG